MWTPGGKERVEQIGRVALTYIHFLGEIASGKLLGSTWSSARCSVMTQMDGMGVGGRSFSEEGCMCIQMTDSFLYSGNKHNIVKQFYSNLKIKKKKKQKPQRKSDKIFLKDSNYFSALKSWVHIRHSTF